MTLKEIMMQKIKKFKTKLFQWSLTAETLADVVL